MKNILTLLGFVFLFVQCENQTSQKSIDQNVTHSSRDYYQLKTYSYKTAKQEKTIDQYLEAAFLPALKRQGAKNIGVFKPRTNAEDTLKKTMVLIPFRSIDQFLNVEASLLTDVSHAEAGTDYINAAHDNPPYERINSVLMQAFTDMPNMEVTPLSGPKSDRVYELRSYESTSEFIYQKKVDMFNAGGEIKLFDRLGFNAVFYAEVLSGDKMPNLVYMTTFPNMAIRDSLWKEFVASPEWQKLITIEKYKNTVSHADIDLLYPTEYSDY